MRLYPASDAQEALLLRALPEGTLDDLDWRTLIMKHLAPGLGSIIAFIM